MKIRRALISVSDKTGVVEFARVLQQSGIEILATGGTARELQSKGIEVRSISDLIDFPEILDGRVKTLHPRIHGGILHQRDSDDHVVQIQAHGIEPIDLVVVNLYPFQQTVAKDGVTMAEAIEQIDIGGPTMIRAAAKNFKHVTVVVDPGDYLMLKWELNEYDNEISPETRQRLALKAFQHTARYDAAISNYLVKQIDEDFFSHNIFLTLEKVQSLRYGENPHQEAALYKLPGCLSNDLVNGQQYAGKELSFNNLLDMDAAYDMVREFASAACVIVKHNNPCGVGLGKTLTKAYEKALATDPMSAFGSIIAFNRPVDEEVARAMRKLFVEVILAPAFDESAFQVFKQSKNLRLIKIPDWDATSPEKKIHYKQIGGGFLAQEKDVAHTSMDQVEIVTERQPTAQEFRALDFAWRVVKYVKSNAIVYALEDRTLGIGAGQMSRVDAAQFGLLKAQQAELSVVGSVLASDAFFPFRDGIDVAAKAGVTAIIQPGGSIRDKDTIAAANEHDIAMVFTRKRHFRH